jgi:hypothetical protein
MKIVGALCAATAFSVCLAHAADVVQNLNPSLHLFCHDDKQVFQPIYQVSRNWARSNKLLSVRSMKG